MFIWKFITITLVKILIRGLRLVGHHGTALPGLLAESIYPGLLKRLAAQLEGGIVIVTGTNGKTTTSKMLRGLLEARGIRVLSNRSGSNFTRGIIASFIDHTTWSGKLDYDMAVLEVDEAYCRLVARQVKPEALLVLNVMRDQMDRYGEIDTTAQLIGEAMEYAKGAILNADDPPVASLAGLLKDKKTTFYGVSPQLKSQLPADEELLSGQSKLKLKSPSRPDLQLTDFQPESNNRLTINDGQSQYSLRLNFNGVHNAQNATAALAALKHLKGAIEQADLDSLASIEPAFGRGEQVSIRGVDTRLALIKNPSGFNQNIRAFALDKKIGAILILINDKYADSRDVSWLWDVDLATLKGRQKELPVVCGGIRAYDMALRLSYEDIEPADIEVSIKSALKGAIDSAPKGKQLLILPTYTAMLEVRKLLSKTTELEKIWR